MSGSTDRAADATSGVDGHRTHRPRVAGAPATSRWRRETLQATLWLVPALIVIVAVVLFVFTNALDRAAANGTIPTPGWVDTGGPDSARLILSTIAGATITVVGVTFSVTIVALTLASTQFGPRMLRNFIRDTGTQVALGCFVATVVFCILALGSVRSGPSGDFTPHFSVLGALVLTLLDMGVLIYFIHHVATSIQMTEVVFDIAGDLDSAVDALFADAAAAAAGPRRAGTPSLDELHGHLDTEGAELPATTSGYLQAVSHDRLVKIATAADATIRLVHRPGHFISRGLPIAVVWPADAAAHVQDALGRAHVVGPSRTLVQDPQFAIDQLVEISLRALSPAVNDTFSALTCIDWLGDALCRLLAGELPSGIYRDDDGAIRLIEVRLRYDRLIDRAFDKVRQAGRGMPAVGIRQLESLAKMAAAAHTDDQRRIIRRQAEMIARSAERDVPEAHDVEDVLAAYATVLTTLGFPAGLGSRRPVVDADATG
jgi:uncharacterized membrane protein